MSRAIFLGSFNPPHQGHVNCIQSVVDSNLMKELNIEKIHVIPCWQNPNKPQQLPIIKRYQMVLFMFGDLIRKEIVCPDDVEDIVKPQYTYQLIDWINEGHDEYFKNGFWWIITSETYLELLEGKWKHSTELIYDNNFILVYKDYNEILSMKSKYPDVKYWQNVKLVLLNQYTGIHSTSLREMIKQGKSIEEYTNTRVQWYIEDQNLYKQ